MDVMNLSFVCKSLRDMDVDSKLESYVVAIIMRKLLDDLGGVAFTHN